MTPNPLLFVGLTSRLARNLGLSAGLICLGLFISFLQPCSAGTKGTSAISVGEPNAAWVPTGDTTSPRADSGISPLMDGRVLVSGGFSYPNRLNTAEIYDPTT